MLFLTFDIFELRPYRITKILVIPNFWYDSVYKEQYWIDMATCPSPSRKYWSPWLFGRQHFEYQ